MVEKLCIELHMCTMKKGQFKITEIIKKTREEVPNRQARELSRTKNMSLLVKNPRVHCTKKIIA